MCFMFSCYADIDPICHVISPLEVEIQPDLTYNEESIRILAREIKELRNKCIALVKVLWNRHGIEEATWEPKEAMQKQYPNLFTDWGPSVFESVTVEKDSMIRPKREVKFAIHRTIHNVFHVFMLCRYRSDLSHVISPVEVEIQPDLTYNEEPIRILAREIKELRNKRIALVKVLWNRHGIEEATWEPEEAMQK
ncbi:receptor-like protein kinase [Gossypium australe]|uniref:Receptor-like protein kinase n=1 Tax=Gossypium australe TaxID=47621 RepID=A0A5B6VW47_9ROSI|nr:receptor-like protein kinase [Gossypium australe]